MITYYLLANISYLLSEIDSFMLLVRRIKIEMCSRWHLKATINLLATHFYEAKMTAKQFHMIQIKFHGKFITGRHCKQS